MSEVSSPALAFYESLTDYGKLQELIDAGEAEGSYLECKSPAAPQLTRDLKAALAQAVSGFANSGGGVMIWGMSTSKHAHSGLDVCTQLSPIGNCKKLAQQIDLAIPAIVQPTLASLASKLIYRNRGDTSGVVVTYFPQTLGDPIKSLVDGKFYIRSGDSFVEMPFEVLKRMFTGVTSPDLAPVFDSRLITADASGKWQVPIILTNLSSTAAENTTVTVRILNPESCQAVEALTFLDVSSVNPGQKIFSLQFEKPIYRGLNQIVGRFFFLMKKGKLAKRVLKLVIVVYSNRMRARQWTMTIQLAKKGFSVRKVGDSYLY